MTWKISLPMYNLSPRLQRGYESLLAQLMEEVNLHDAVELVRAPALPALWRRPDMLLSQTCGYPYVTQLQDYVTLIATPGFDFAGCSGSDYASVIVVREDGGIGTLGDARGRIVASNDPHSNSGMNVLRHAVAPLARGEAFFESVKWSGSHAASLAMVRDGEADIAAIDCVSYGYISQEDALSLKGLRVLQYSAVSPGLPLVAGRLAPAELVNRLRAALLEPSQRLRELMSDLHIVAFEHRTDYGRILQIEDAAVSLAYPQLV
jgi:ABC-type phosphate/phosphonate transport system substrate-binding protein